MSASPGAPQSAQTSFPGICWISRRNRAALWLCDISLPDLRVSGGGGDVRAAPPRSRRLKACSHLAVLRGQVRTGSSPQSGRRRNSDRVTPGRLTSWFGAELSGGSGGASRLSQERRANPAGGSEKSGLSKLSFPHCSARFVRAPAPRTRTRTLTVVRSGSRSCHICASARQASFSEGEHAAALEVFAFPEFFTTLLICKGILAAFTRGRCQKGCLDARLHQRCLDTGFQRCPQVSPGHQSGCGSTLPR